MHGPLILSRRRGGQALSFLYALAASAVAAANPRDAVVVHGSASFAMPNAQTLEITNSPSAILNWQSFNIAAGETTRFIQQNAQSAVLNRVVAGNASEILGNLMSNGRVFLINPAGILIGRDAVVDTAGLVLSTLQIRDQDFLAGRLQFEGDATSGAITNHGYIKTGPGGEIIFIAPRIVNEALPGSARSGLIESPEGELVLAAGEAITIASLDHPDITFDVRAPEHEAINLGRLLAAGGSVSVLAGSIHNSGSISADAVTRDGAGNIVLAATGRVYLDAGSSVSASGPGDAGKVDIQAGTGDGAGRIYALGNVAATGDNGGAVNLASDRILVTGTVSAAGTNDGGAVTLDAGTEVIATASARLDASGTTGEGGTIAVDGGEGTFSSALMTATGISGGRVEVLGDEVKLAAATIDASGTTGGGTVRVGGGFQGGEGLHAATTTVVNAATVIKADAQAAGNGGDVVVWADDTTRFEGIISARAGAAFGNGGDVEVSGKQSLGFTGQVDVSAANGQAGTLLLDPKNIFFTDEEIADGIQTFQLLDPHPGLNNNFGQSFQTFFESSDFTTPAKMVVFDQFDDFGGADAGAVYLYRMSDGALLAALTGSRAGDRVGNNTLQAVGDVRVLRSTLWNSNRGAITVYDVVNGVNGVVGAANSLVGANAGDQVGSGGVQALGSSIAVRSPEFNGTRGAVTIAPAASLRGTVGTGNSLVGANINDRVGNNFFQSVGSGNFVLSSTHGGAGAVTFINPTSAPKGVVGAANSLVGSAPTDAVGSFGIDILGSFYAVRSPDWNGTAGAYTIASSATGRSGVVGAGNSLVGAAAGDFVGANSAQSLFTGRYALISEMSGLGAVTVFDPASAPVGVVSAANSLIGDNVGDEIGSGGLQFLGSSIWAVFSPLHDGGGTTDAGAVSFLDGSNGHFAGTGTGFVGNVSAANSLVGTSDGDQVGSNGIDFVSGSLYAVLSPLHDNTGSGNVDTGALTWYTVGDALAGVVDGTNSLLGIEDDDQIGGFSNFFQFLPGGNRLYVAPDYGLGAGAVVFIDPTAPVTGDIDGSTALVGAVGGDGIGSGGIEVFDDFYVVLSPDFDNSTITNAGAVTVGSNATGVSGTVDATNSLVGSGLGDRVGSGGLEFLFNGNAIVYSPDFNGGAGAVTFLDFIGSGALLGDTDFAATLSAANSLVGSDPGDAVGSGGIEFAGNYYIVLSPQFGTSFENGAVTVVDIDDGVAGTVGIANSLLGANAGDHIGSDGLFFLSNGNVLVLSPDFDTTGGAITYLDLVNGNIFGEAGFTGIVGAGNSLVGNSDSGDVIGSGGIDEFFAGLNHYYGVFSPDFNGGAGAVTFVDAAGGAGLVSSSNSLVGTAAGDRVGDDYQQLSNGNVVLLSEQWNGTRGAATFVDLIGGGASLIGDVDASNSAVGSTIGDRVGSDGIEELFGYGRYAILSPEWTNGAAAAAGAITWGDIDNGVNGSVDGSNSLLGVFAGDRVGECCSIDSVTGDLFVIDTPDFDGGKSALTFFDATAPLPMGEIDGTNSLLGSTAGDALGSGGIFPVFTSGGTRVVVESPNWDNGSEADAGAVTTFLATSPKTGTLNSANSLVGTLANDRVGDGFMQTFSNGNRVIVHSAWRGNTGAVTFWNTSTDLTGELSAANSLIGATPGTTTTGDRIGSFGVSEVSGSGRYYVASPNWNGGMGAISFGSITSGVAGLVAAGNSVVGSTAGDRIGQEIYTVSNRLVVVSDTWNAARGAVTVINPAAPRLGALTAANSLVGSSAGDRVGDFVQFLFTSGNSGRLVLRTNTWNSNAGAVTVFDPLAPLVGAVSSANSLVGRPGDRVGSNGVTELANGGLLVRSSEWSDGQGLLFGAVTLMLPNAAGRVQPTTGFVSASNSLVGSHANDTIGSTFPTFLPSGNLLLRNSSWFDNRGAVTFVDVTQGIRGEVSNRNSLVGELANDFLGSGGISLLGGERALVRSPLASVNGIAGAGRLDVINAAVRVPFTGSVGFGTDPNGELLVSISSLIDLLNSGASLTLQANNDIVLAAGLGIIAERGSLFMEAGRSIDIQGDVIVRDGTLSLLANAPGAASANREEGEGNIYLMATDRAVRVIAANLVVDAQNIFVAGGNSAGAHAALFGLGTTSIHAHGSGLLRLEGGTAAGTSLSLGTSQDIVQALLINPSSISAPVALVVGQSALNVIADDVQLAGGGSDGAFAALVSFGDFNVDAINIDLTAGSAANADALLLGLGGIANINFTNCNGCVDLLSDPLLDGSAQTGIYRAGVFTNPSVDAILAMLGREDEESEEEDDEEDEDPECD